MQHYSKIILKKGKEASLKRFHPWVFSGAIAQYDRELADGDTVMVFAWNKEFLGIGHFQPNLSIRVRIFSFFQVEPDFSFWKAKISTAYTLRQSIGLVNNSETTAYRLVSAEGDGMPGLVIDIYGNVAVFQAHTLGMYLARDLIASALKEVYGEKLQAVYDKSKETLAGKGQSYQNDYLIGNTENETVIKEYGNQFKVNWEQGQKTGFFLDQRENRKLLGTYAKGKTILNAFCYTGGFSVYGMQGEAQMVHSVDISKPAINLTDENIALNNNGNTSHNSFAVDVFEHLNDNNKQYDLIVLDPPAFAKHQSARHKAINGYKYVNSEAIKNIKPGGILFTFSCSQVVDKSLFSHTIMAAAIQAGRNVRVLHQLGQPPDHPVSIYHPEGEYLKGLVLYVE